MWPSCIITMNKLTLVTVVTRAAWLKLNFVSFCAAVSWLELELGCTTPHLGCSQLRQVREQYHPPRSAATLYTGKPQNYFSYKHTLLQEYETNNEVILLFCKFSTMFVLLTKPGAQCGESRALGFCPNLYSEFSGDAIVRELGCMNTMYWRIALWHGGLASR